MALPWFIPGRRACRCLLRSGSGLFLGAALAARGNNGIWDTRFHLPGIHGEVHAVATRDTEIYAGGEFTSADRVIVNNIAHWNGTNWVPMGGGVNGRVNAIAVWGTDVIAAGTFTKAGALDAIDASLIARWDGSEWSALGSGIAGARVEALAVDAFGALYAGGEFTDAGGVAAANIARWDGLSWSALGTGLRNDPYAAWVFALATRGTEVFAGGFFTDAGGVNVSCLARWDGLDWADVGGGVDDHDYLPQVTALAVRGDDLYVGGGFRTAGNVGVANIARWDGQWSELGNGLGRFFGDLPVTALEVNVNDLFVGGRFISAGEGSATNLACWNGSSWSEFAGGIEDVEGEVNALAISGGRLLVGGSFLFTNALRPSALARWDITAWNVISSGGGLGLSGPLMCAGACVGDTVSALAVTGSTVYVAGGLTAAGGRAIANVARWEGLDWSSLGSGLNGPVYALCQFGSQLVAGGQFNLGGGANVARWNGVQWLPFGQGIAGPVYALAADNGKLYAGGAFTTAGSIVASNLACWNGVAWTPLGGGVNGPVYALAAGGGILYAGGRFNTASGANATNVARWNGAAWTPLGGGLSGRASTIVRFRPPPVSALLLDGGDLIVGGDFAKAGDVAATNLARWNGTGWSPVGDGVTGRVALAPPPAVRSLLRNGDELLVAGSFVQAGEVPASGLAGWNGTNWSAVNSGSTAPVEIAALARQSGHLFVGGRFQTVGGRAAVDFSILHDRPFLLMARRGGAVEIAWPGAGPDAFLVSAETISTPVWRPVTNMVLLPGGEAATVPLRSNQTEFFRLRLP